MIRATVTGERERRETVCVCVCLRGCTRHRDTDAVDPALRQLLGSSSREDQSLRYTWSEQRLTQRRTEEGRRSEAGNPLPDL